MNIDVVVSVITGILVLIGLAGIVVPILPGSITIIVGLLVWAIFIGWPLGWVVFVIGAALCLAGMVGTYVLTGRVLKREKIPNRSIVIGLVVGVVGMFLVPVVGLPLGFALGLFAAEYLRVGEVPGALKSSWEAIKAAARGILLEFGLSGLAVVTWLVGLSIRF